MSGEQIFPSGVKTNDGGVAGLDPQLLQRVDTGDWVTVETGVEYWAPNQHGNAFGKVVRQYFSGSSTGTGANLLSGGTVVDKLIGTGGYVKSTEGNGVGMAIGTNFSPSTLATIRHMDSNLEADYIQLSVGTAMDSLWDYYAYIDYTKETPPGTSPSSKVMPTIDPTVLQRVDDMTWEEVPQIVGTFNIISVADGGGGKILCTTSRPHGLSVGQTVKHSLSFTNIAYEGDFAVTDVDSPTTYKVTATYTATDEGAGSSSISVTSVAQDGSYIVCTTAYPHGLATGQLVFHYSDFTDSAYEGQFEVIVLTSTTYKVLATYTDDDSGTAKAIASAEYFSTEQHGGIYGKVIRRYAGLTRVATAAGITLFHEPNLNKIISFNGPVSDNSDATPLEAVAAGYYNSGVYGTVIMQRSDHNVELGVGSVLDEISDSFLVWVDYTLASEPTTRPTGQPFADPHSPMLKRADTGAWQVPVEGVEYIAKNQQGGLFGTIYTQVVKKITTQTASGIFLTISGSTVTGILGERLGYRRASNGEWYANTIGTSGLVFLLSTLSNNIVYYNNETLYFDRVYGEIDYSKTMPTE